MSVWFLRGLRRGIVTTRYPVRPEPSTLVLPSPPAFRPELLSRDLVDAMAGSCPSAALRRENGWLVYDVGACTACGRCYAVAGPAATPSGQIELAATHRSQLIKRIPIGDGHGQRD
jgi:hypothetical protein